MFGIGMPELVVILLIAVLLFGASKLPQIGRGLGKAIREFKQAGKELKSDLGEAAKIVDDKKEQSS